MRPTTSWEFYQAYPHPLILPLLEISLRGVRVNRVLREEATEAYETKERDLTAQLHALVGTPLDPHSPKQLMAYVYDEQGVGGVTRLRTNVRGEKLRTSTLDETAIAELLTRTLPTTVRQVIELVLEIRGVHKILATYLKAPLDPDHRLRCSYALTGTKTGRLSSRATPRGTGTNLQNIPPGIAREMLLPDEGMVFLSADLSQAEARVVAYLARDERLISVFTQGGDIHRRNAARIFKLPEEAVSPAQRQLAKKIIHASNYGMGPWKFAQEAGVSKREAEHLLALYFQTYPRIKVWHLEVEEQLRKTRVLTTPLGRRRQFFGAWGDDLLREAYAYVPQSTVSDILNSGLLAYHATGVGQIVLQEHDAIIVQVPHAQIEEARRLLVLHLTRPIQIHDQECVIPVTLKQGATWDALQ